MSNLKKTALAVIALGSTAAFAGTMGPVCSAVNVTVPCENTAWDLGGRALYLQPTRGGFGGQQTITQGTALNSPANTASFGQTPGYNWGFQFEGSYHFNTGNDFNVNWYHFRGSNSSTLVPTAAQAAAFNTYIDLVSPIVTTTGTPSSINQASSSDWDQVNMEFAQHVDFGENKFARFHAGMQFARVAGSTTLNPNGVSLNYNGTALGTFNGSFNPTTVYNGFGPRVGTDLTYDWGNGLSVYGTGALGLLAGSTKASINPTITNATSGVTNTLVSTSYSSARVVPTLDAKLGFMYTYAMAQGDLSFDIGWLWNEYIGALDGFSFDGASSQDTNFGIQGVYFGLKWVGNVA